MPSDRPLTPKMGARGSSRPRLSRLLGLSALALLIWGASASAGDKITPEALKKVKAATVHVKVTFADGDVSEGSGFATRLKGLVVTNAHVVGMLDNDSVKPTKIEVTFNSGETNSKTIVSKIGYVDGDSDLALLMVPSGDFKEYPELLSVAYSQQLTETQDVFIVGFPLGKQAGSNVSVTATTVTSLRKEGGNIKRVQVGGGMHPGNSGGPLVDKDGKVVGIAVSGFAGTQVHLAIPTEVMNSVFNGRIRNSSYGTPYRDGDKIKVPIRFEKADPLNLMKTITVETWIGKPGPIRPTGSKEPEPLPDDSPIVALEVKPDDKGVYSGELELDGKKDPKLSYWMRYKVGRGGDKSLWYPGSVLRPATAVDRKAATFKYEPPLNTTDTLLVTSDASFRIREAEGDDHSLSMLLKGTLKETVNDQTKEGKWRKRVTYDGLEVTAAIDKNPIPGAERLTKALKDIKLLASEIDVAKDGTIARDLADFSKVPQASRPPLSLASDQMQQSLDTLAFPFPEKEIEAQGTWKGKQSFDLGALGYSVPTSANITYKLEGLFVAPNGKTVAVITFSGTLQRDSVAKPKKGMKEAKLSGYVEGKIELLPETGVLITGTEKVRAELDMEFDGKSAKAIGVLDVRVTRLGPPPPKK
jgi:S1-C subfamily serine protease